MKNKRLAPGASVPECQTPWLLDKVFMPLRGTLNP